MLPDKLLIEYSKQVWKVITLFGFYFQPSTGGRQLGTDFWHRCAAIDNVVAIKIGPFNRFQTFDVVWAVAKAGRAGQIALCTGNDDNIVADLLGDWEFKVGGHWVVGGLLGHWAYWTQKAVEVLYRCHEAGRSQTIPARLNRQVTEMNAAVFDVAHDYAGCIPGIHEVLRRNGLLEGRWCLAPDRLLGPGQTERIATVADAYPRLTDDEFVAEHRDQWLR